MTNHNYNPTYFQSLQTYNLSHPNLGSNYADYLNKLQVVYSGYLQSCVYLHRSFLCWGSNQFGEADLPTAQHSEFILFASIGRHYICIIQNDKYSEVERDQEEFGDAFCWGNNSENQTEVPDTLVRGSTVSIIRAGDWHTCAIGKEEATCWGMNDHGQLDIAKEKINLIAAMSVRQFSTCIISNSVISCFGKFQFNKVYESEVYRRFAMIFLGYNHVCYNLSQVICEGDNEYGQLNFPDRYSIMLSMGSYGDHSCASDFSGGIPNNKCWGRNDKGQTDLTKLTTKDFTFSIVGEKHSCFVKGSTYVECIGTDEYGLNEVPEFIKSKINIIDVGGKFTCAIIGGVVKCFGKNQEKLNKIPDEHIKNSNDISTGFNHLCSTFVILGEHSTWACWSAKSKEKDLIRPPEVLKEDHLINNFMSSGYKFTCITVKHLINADITHAFCWGVNDQGQTDIPPDLEGPVQKHMVKVGIAHACATTLGLRLFCWGRNDKEQATVPSLLLFNTASVGCGYYHTCAVDSAERGECWGYNNKGQTDIPKQIQNQLVWIVGGGDFSCGMRVGKVYKMYCWGGSGVMQVPKAVSAGLGKLRAGQNHACLVKEYGKAYCWGDDEEGQVGWLGG